MKICTTCKKEKPLSEFNKLCKSRAHISDGHQPQCKQCRNAYDKTPARRKAIRLQKKRYFLNPENLAKQKEQIRQHSHTEQGKKIHAKANAKYRKTQKGKDNDAKCARKYRQTQKYKNAINKHRLKFPEKRKAGIIVMNALKSGEIIRPDSCSICNKKCIPEGHHDDYSKPLEVVWMCKNCHTAIHWRP